MCSKNVLSTWKAAGLVPYASSKGINWIPTPPKPRTPVLQATTMDGFMDILLLASSPPEGTSLRASNACLRVALCSGESLSNPARQYINCLTETSERLEVQLQLLQSQTKEKELVLQKRQTVHTGK